LAGFEAAALAFLVNNELAVDFDAEDIVVSGVRQDRTNAAYPI